MTDKTRSPGERGDRVRYHLAFGWWSLLVFLSLGIGLEALHGFKVGEYLDADNEVRRLTWTLAHAHGALLGLVHVAFGATLSIVQRAEEPWNPRTASRSLSAASVMLPLGFFLGGFGTAGGDPGIGIVFVPIGALALFIAVLLTALAMRRRA
ncbi:MAG: hypothetical protein AB7S26_18055 [Sandaracinaceae bacterium]